MNHSTSSRHRSRAFTLIEVLIVVTIMALLLSVTASVSQGVVNSMNFRQAIQNVKTQLEAARQSAMTTNRSVMVRLIEGEDEFGNPIWNGLQIGSAESIVDPAAANYATPVSGSFEPQFKAIDSIETLPTGFVFHPASTYSTLLSNHASLNTGTMTDSAGSSRKYTAFSFLPDGRCSLPSDTDWTLTLVREQDIKAATLPADYATIQLDPRTARTRVYRR
ncbi:Verru_Chthon cassette protein D [Phragmitibacter flavus]|uniref:Verru_Chthon cassette protein D n=1 Tax=Phragmitibacter flavus TaxID=2576071 RepID=A0A5R8K8C8_9BACT|nr:Verru_Chthon cassette protein D [Phragmitibacter flavus]TLD68561.1 Verru_Chthon cassette protein D [Phragmitibacter flavus]